MILITLGILIMLNSLGIYGFNESWPILLIIIAVGTLIQRVKDIGGWFIAVAGVMFFIVQNKLANMNQIASYLLPVLLILVGFNIVRKGRKNKQD
jgi:ABC-type polysaccharide/polyol phosphate export permease